MAEDTFEHDVPLKETEPMIRKLADNMDRVAHRITSCLDVVLKLKTSEFKILTRRPHASSTFFLRAVDEYRPVLRDVSSTLEQRFRLVGVAQQLP